MFEFLKRRKPLPRRSLDEIKDTCRIIFVDNEKFEVVNILKDAGWKNTSHIKDIESLDTAEVKNAHILFIDIHDVGKKMKFRDEGLGLIIALKDKYPNKKIIVYSATSEGDRFHEGLSKADARLSKNADPYQFQQKVELFSKEAFSLDECIERIRNILKNELGYSIETNEIIKRVEQIYKRGSYDPSHIARVFNIQNASNLATIIQLFLSGK